jgi:hypothetical protein
MAAAQKGARVPGRSEVAQRVWQAIEATDESVAGLPVKVADAVLVALGSSAAEHEQLMHDLTRQFRSHLIYAVEAIVHRVLIHLGKPGQPGNG